MVSNLYWTGGITLTLNDRVKSNYSFYGRDVSLVQDTVWVRVLPARGVASKNQLFAF